ncbi:MAG: ABC transporter ATP-binding protein [Thermofilum sp.]|jgi:ABC-type Fe3+/spermidine/putrescine transport system ATPase subunit|nr:ABC transporter ATP-binding protein [Thermofilum sp.]
MARGVEVRVENVSKVFRDRGVTQALRGVSLTVRKGELFSILGPSGCGKTTLLRILAGLLKPDEGRVFFDGVDVTDVPAYERPIGMVFQDLALFPHLTVYRNVSFSLEIAGWPSDRIERRVREVLQLVRLPYEEFAHRKISQLSGGQQQRVAIARALAREPKLLLLDEPFSHLDYKIRIELIHELKRLQRETGVTTIYVTHDRNEAMLLSDRLAVMKDGVVQQVGTPEEVYRSPANAFVASFLGEVNIIPAKAVNGLIKLGDLEISLERLLPGLGNYTGDVLLLLRPESISLTPPGGDGALRFRVQLAEKVFLGPYTKLLFSGWGDIRLEALAPTREAALLEPGSVVDVYVEASEMRVYTD